MTIRPATLADVPAISAIYNHYVLHSTATYQEDPESVDDRVQWLEAHGPRHPVLVAAEEEAIVGWASLSPFHSRSAFRFTVEDSVYLRDGWQGRGLGRQLLEALIPLARKAGHHGIVAAISGDQEPSLRLHERCGFVKCGHIPEAGLKFGRWLDMVYMKLALSQP